MKQHVCLISLLLTIAFPAMALHFDYELSRGRNMWTGWKRAVHYYDHFKLLTHRMDRVEGLVTSYYPFIYENEWSLAFNMMMTGKASSSTDGFMLMLSSESVDSHDFGVKKTAKKRFVDFMVT